MDEGAPILDGTVEEITAKLGGMTVDQLTALHAEEESGKNRSSLLAAIDKEKAATLAKGDGGNGDGGDDDSATFTKEQVDQMLADQKVKLDADADRRIAEAKGQAAPKPGAVKKAKPLTIDAKADGPATTVLTEGAEVVFVDDDDVPIAALPPMVFGKDAFEPAGMNAVKLIRDVDFPNSMTAAEISGAFVTGAKGAPIGKASLIGPFAIGGGRDAKLGAGALMFTKD